MDEPVFVKTGEFDIEVECEISCEKGFSVCTMRAKS